MTAVRGVYLSEALDLPDIYARAFEPYREVLILVPPEAVADPEAITFALAWKPAPEAFAPYPNLRLVSSIAAGGAKDAAMDSVSATTSPSALSACT